MDRVIVGWTHNREDLWLKNGRASLEKLIAITLLNQDTSSWGDWKQWIVGHGPKHIVSCCYLYKVLKCNWFSVVRCWINFKIGFWGS